MINCIKLHKLTLTHDTLRVSYVNLRELIICKFLITIFTLRKEKIYYDNRRIRRTIQH